MKVNQFDPYLTQDEIDSVVELLQGKLSSGVMRTITDKKNGLFPQPQEISLGCSCPDWADMCKHVAAVLYGIGARLDEEPELLFKLRHVDHLDLINKTSLKVSTKRSGRAKVIEGQNLSNLFGIEIETKPESLSKESGKRSLKLGKAKKKSVLRKSARHA